MERNDIHLIALDSVGMEFENNRRLFQKINFQLEAGKIVWLTGVSGSGKSVLMKILSGLLTPTEGLYYLNNLPVNFMSFEEFLPYRLNIGYSFDFGGLINNRTIRSNLELPLEYHNIGDSEEREQAVEKYMEIFGLQAVAEERPSAIVGGMRKAACVARSFITNPQVLLLDDPTTGLRGHIKEKLKNLILENLEKKTVRFVFVATDDESFMKDLNPIHVQVGGQNVQVVKKRGVA